MARDLSTQTATTGIAPTIATRELSLTVAKIHNAVRQLAWNRFEIAAERAPTADEREAIERRRAELEDGLQPAEPRTALAALSRMFVGFPNTSAANSPEDAWERAEGLRRIPSASSRCGRSARPATTGGTASTGEGPFAPSTAQFAPTVAAETLSFRTELGRLKAVLDAKVIGDLSPEGRARTARLGEEAAAKMRAEHFAAVERQAVIGPRCAPRLRPIPA
jgi:hypothetical protein